MLPHRFAYQLLISDFVYSWLGRRHRFWADFQGPVSKEAYYLEIRITGPKLWVARVIHSVAIPDRLSIIPSSILIIPVTYQRNVMWVFRCIFNASVRLIYV